MSGVLVVPVETQARELDAKLLLAAYAAEQGFQVWVGSKKELNKRIASLPRSTFLSKSLTKRNLLNYELLERLGHRLVCGDEEALVYASPDSYLHHKVAAKTFDKARVLLAWGKRNAELWRGYAGYRGAPIHVTGNARMDLLRPELRALFEPEAARLRERFGRFLLVNTNFSRLNHYFPGQSRQRRALEEAGPTGRPDLGRGLAAHKARLYAYFREMVPALARACPGHTIVVRPHPSERAATWSELAQGVPNLRVVGEGSVVPWLIACESMVHNGCQTAVESYLLDAPAVAYQPVTSEDFDLQLPNLLSERCFDLESLLETVRSRLAGRRRTDPSEREKQEELVGEFVAAREGALASDRIAHALGEDAAARPESERLGSGRLGAAAVARARGALQRAEAYWPGHHNNRVFLRHVFPGVSLDAVRQRVDATGRLLGRFDRVRVAQRYPNVFVLEAR